MSADTQKVLENRLRRVAARRGLTFSKVRRMDSGASDFGRIHLLDSAGDLVFDGADVREVESFLDGPDRGRRIALGRLLLQVQDAHGWLPAEAAAANGVAPMTWRRLTAGEPVRSKAMSAAAQALGAPLSDVLSALRSEAGMLALNARCAAPGNAAAAVPANEVDRGVGNPRQTIADLRAELMELADSVAGYALPPSPARIVKGPLGDNGPLWNVQQTMPMERNHARLAVRCIDNEPGVFVEGAAFSFGGDWHALSSQEARSFAMALLAAADWTDGQDEIGQRRTRKAAEVTA